MHVSVEMQLYTQKQWQYMFQMQSNGESDENILYPLTTNTAEALVGTLKSVFFHAFFLQHMKLFILTTPLTMIDNT